MESARRYCGMVTKRSFYNGTIDLWRNVTARHVDIQKNSQRHVETDGSLLTKITEGIILTYRKIINK